MKMWSSATLVELMKRKNMQTTRLAHYAKCSPAMVSHLRKGRRDGCSDPLARRIAEALDVPLSALFDPSTATDSSGSADQKGAA